MVQTITTFLDGIWLSWWKEAWEGLAFWKLRGSRLQSQLTVGNSNKCTCTCSVGITTQTRAQARVKWCNHNTARASLHLFEFPVVTWLWRRLLLRLLKRTAIKFHRVTMYVTPGFRWFLHHHILQEVQVHPISVCLNQRIDII